MKAIKPVFVFAAIAIATAASAQMNMGETKGMDMGQKGDMKGMDMAPKPGAGAAGQVHHARGTVKKADSKHGIVAVAHGPVESLNWPAMTMSFKVKDKKLWSNLHEGKEVDLDFVQEGKDYVISKVK